MVSHAKTKEFQPKPLGMYLVEAELITPTELNIALEEQKVSGKQLGEILVMLGLIKQQTIEYFMEKVVLPERQKFNNTSSDADRSKSKHLSVLEQVDPTKTRKYHQLDVFLSAKRVVKFLLGIVFFLTIISVVVNFTEHYLPDYPSRELFKDLFDLDSEMNIPSLYSAGALLFCSILLATISKAKKAAGNNDYRSWAGLSIVFVYLSFDEFISIHEKLILPLRNALHTRGFLYYPWVIAGAICVALFLLLFWRFVITLPKKIRRLFLIAGTIYIAGAIGAEMVGGFYADYYTDTNMIFVLITTLEEVLEMMGVIVFIYGLLSYISSYMNGIDVEFHIIDSKKQRLIT
ncbi:hypothetical protein CEN44_22965 [Fischerella muscicola CCMEE 5323]|uniref:Uncharacterized protein n=1 Tax=Fischerella muscicola CCMEE 5323 TaxID=2019572 RepID=A0A2N6JXI6_FISMU|nr:hypothetical protein [Fischerella muscicola]PLZ85175.1 hypothetical protein CEN44_22965 [Fischerella muscicola CCMEE 5323]